MALRQRDGLGSGHSARALGEVLRPPIAARGVVLALSMRRRAYHILLEVDDCLVLMGGQTFTTFFNDVWRTCDGVKWELLTKSAPWAPRAGLAGNAPVPPWCLHLC